MKAACAWVQFKFGIVLSPQDVADLEPAAFKAMVRRRAEEAYHEKEVVYPVMAGLYHFTTRDPGGHKHYDREELARWARQRFQVDLDLEDLKNKQRDEIRDVLVEQSRRHGEPPQQAAEQVQTQWAAVFNGQAPSAKSLRDAAGDGRLESLSRWAADELHFALSPEEMLRLPPDKVKNRLEQAVEELYRPEMRRLERALLLQILDDAWKNHLLTMDHLKSSIGLRGYAQVDPKVEYKREGMKTFEEMWDSVGEPRDRPRFPRRTTRRGFCRLDVEGDGSGPRGRLRRRRHCPTAAASDRRHAGRSQAAADSQPPAARRPQRSLSLRQREEVQALPHAEVKEKR